LGALPFAYLLRYHKNLNRDNFTMALFQRHASLLMAIIVLLRVDPGLAFSTPKNDNSASFTLFDRFRAVCPADPSSVSQFDSSLVSASQDHNDDADGEDDSKSVWVAVYRSTNNKPSVLVKDSFLQAMRSATDSVSASSSASDSTLLGSFEQNPGVAQQAPVAVARLRESTHFDGSWVLDSMRCVLKKETTDASCDGGSEHIEAISTAVDTLLLHYLSLGSNRFESAIRTKATLLSGSLLEERGFRPVQDLQKDMVTHVSSLDECLDKYASRSVDTIAKSPGAQQRALTIVSLLGRIDRHVDLREASQAAEQDSDDDADDYDPWASVKRFL
jgi:hypothetical protein